MHCCALLSGSIDILFMCISCLFCEQINGYGYGYVTVSDLTIVSKKNGSDLESMKAYNIKIIDDINAL